MPPSAAPPSPQEIHRKLSISSVVHSKASLLPPPVTVPPVFGTESDSDSNMTPDWTHSSSGLISGNISGTTTMLAGGGSLQQQPLSSIAERSLGSGGEDSEDDDDEGEGGWNTAQANEGHVQGNMDETVIKSGYLWKKGERRKTWKKRWFVLRPAHLAYYKTAAEYQLLRLLELSDVHSCTTIPLKKHENAFGLISPVRTFYLQAKTATEVQDWVKAIEETRQALNASSNHPVAATPSKPIPIPRGSTAHPHPPIIPSPPSFVSHNATSSDSEDASSLPFIHSNHRTNSTSSQTRPTIASAAAAAAAASPSKSPSAAGAPPKDPTKIVLSGYLMKCGSKRRNWRKRWFVLSGERLVYSASHMDTKPHRQFPFSDILDALEYDVVSHRNHHHPPSVSSPTSIEGGSSEGGGGPSTAHTFKIITSKRTLLLCAPTEEDEIKWLSAVRALIARRSHSGASAGETSAKTAHTATGGSAASTSASGFATAAGGGGGGSASHTYLNPNPNQAANTLNQDSMNVNMSPQSSGFSSGTSGTGIKAKARRLSASGGVREEASS
ncbi:hypothetical protein D9757_009340 [Collybiopsis confluens]|uniref:PH domain-containing protein n=1 Tax=Collybiopsis confluens TaxID=2823264 RepID=A0A8H5H3N2_9AGAR|nr:hypothetical protein D9757_009340 [Collybiopsis confluens]